MSVILDSSGVLFLPVASFCQFTGLVNIAFIISSCSFLCVYLLPVAGDALGFRPAYLMPRFCLNFIKFYSYFPQKITASGRRGTAVEYVSKRPCSKAFFFDNSYEGKPYVLPVPKWHPHSCICCIHQWVSRMGMGSTVQDVQLQSCLPGRVSCVQ